MLATHPKVFVGTAQVRKIWVRHLVLQGARVVTFRCGKSFGHWMTSQAMKWMRKSTSGLEHLGKQTSNILNAWGRERSEFHVRSAQTSLFERLSTHHPWTGHMALRFFL